MIDEETLQTVADMTGGAYFRAENADQLLEVFLNLPTQITLQKERLEVSVLFSILGAIFATVAVGLALIWNRYRYCMTKRGRTTGPSGQRKPVFPSAIQHEGRDTRFMPSRWRKRRRVQVYLWGMAA